MGQLPSPTSEPFRINTAPREIPLGYYKPDQMSMDVTKRKELRKRRQAARDSKENRLPPVDSETVISLHTEDLSELEKISDRLSETNPESKRLVKPPLIDKAEFIGQMAQSTTDLVSWQPYKSHDSLKLA